MSFSKILSLEPTQVLNMRRIFRPSWPNPEASIAYHETYAPISGRKFWPIQGPAAAAYETIKSELKQTAESRGKDLYDGLNESELPNSIDCFMVGKTVARARPSIVISGGQKLYCRRMRGIIQTSAWWITFIELHPGFEDFVLLPWPPRRLGRADTRSPDHEWAYTSDRIQALQSAPLYFAGGQLNRGSLFPDWQASLGQIIYLNDIPYGLTVAHPLSPTFHNPITSLDEADFQAEFDDEDDEDEDGELGSGIDDFDRIRIINASLAPPMTSISLQTENNPNKENTHQSSVGGFVESVLSLGPIRERSTGQPQDPLDWALIGLEDTLTSSELMMLEDLTNAGTLHTEDGSITSIPKAHSIAIKSSTTVPVYVAYPNDELVSGVIGPSTSLVCLSGSREYLELHHVILATELRPGDCGKWVVDQHGNWHGHIVATIPNTNIAYIASAQSIVDDIVLRKGPHIEISLVNPRPLSLGRRLWDAAMSGKKKLVIKLLEQGAMVDTKEGPYGSTPLIEAATEGQFDIVTLLLECNANPDSREEQYRTTALWAAAERGHVKIVELLIRADVHLNALSSQPLSQSSFKKPWQTTALYAASVNRHYSVVKALITTMNSVTISSSMANEALNAAAHAGDLKTVLLLTSDPYPNRTPADGCERALVTAIKRNDMKVVKALIDGGIYFSASSFEDRDTLFAAVSQGNHEIALILFEAGVTISTASYRHGTVLHLAAQRGDLDMAELLIGNGANVDSKYGGYGSAINTAALYGHEQVVALLLKHGASLIITGKEQRTAMDLAASMGHVRTLELLLDSGAVADPSNAKMTAVIAAAYGGHLETVRFLLSRPVDSSSATTYYSMALSGAAAGGHLDIVRLLVSAGADVNTPGSPEHRACLMAAASGGHASVVEFLLDSGADVNTSSGPDGTALSAAAFRGHVIIVGMLLDRGANIDQHDREYSTALFVAANQDRQETVKYLLARGANRWIRDMRSQKTAADIAADQKYTQTAAILQQYGWK